VPARVVCERLRADSYVGLPSGFGQQVLALDMTTINDLWTRYGRTLTSAMAEVLDEIPEELRSHVLETADYWISVGLTIGLERPHQARRLLELIEVEESERATLAEDAAAFIEEALS
jgi:hypothetical protein